MPDAIRRAAAAAEAIAAAIRAEQERIRKAKEAEQRRRQEAAEKAAQARAEAAAARAARVAAAKAKAMDRNEIKPPAPQAAKLAANRHRSNGGENVSSPTARTAAAAVSRDMGASESNAAPVSYAATRRAVGGYGKLQPPAELEQLGNGKIPAGALKPLGIGSHALWAPAADQFNKMVADAKAQGVTIGITDSYRTYETQVDLVRRKGLYSQGGLAAEPGTSNHGWGMAVDLDLNDKAQAWMRENGAKYGYVEDTPREPWHWGFRPDNMQGVAQAGSSGAVAAANIVEGKGLSNEQMQAVFPNLAAEKAKDYLPYLNAAMKEFGIEKPEHVSAFLAQLAHESGGLKYFEEIASGAAYEGRGDLGNTQSGDGVRFKGRGPIQLTGRSNYRTTGDALGIDLENNPEIAATKEVGFRTAAHFWKSRDLGNVLDSSGFDAVSKRINGGTNGLQDRRDQLARISNILGTSGLGSGPVATGYENSGTYTASGNSASSNSTGGSGGSRSSSNGGSYSSSGNTSSGSSTQGSSSTNSSPFTSNGSNSPSSESQSGNRLTVESPYMDYALQYGGAYGFDPKYLSQLLEKMFGSEWVKSELPKDVDFKAFVKRATGGEPKDLSLEQMEKLTAEFLTKMVNAEGVTPEQLLAELEGGVRINGTQNIEATPESAEAGTDAQDGRPILLSPEEDGDQANRPTAELFPPTVSALSLMDPASRA